MNEHYVNAVWLLKCEITDGGGLISPADMEQTYTLGLKQTLKTSGTATDAAEQWTKNHDLSTHPPAFSSYTHPFSFFQQGEVRKFLSLY